MKVRQHARGIQRRIGGPYRIARMARRRFGTWGARTYQQEFMRSLIGDVKFVVPYLP